MASKNNYKFQRSFHQITRTDRTHIHSLRKSIDSLNILLDRLHRFSYLLYRIIERDLELLNASFRLRSRCRQAFDVSVKSSTNLATSFELSSCN